MPTQRESILKFITQGANTPQVETFANSSDPKVRAIAESLIEKQRQADAADERSTLELQAKLGHFANPLLAVKDAINNPNDLTTGISAVLSPVSVGADTIEEGSRALGANDSVATALGIIGDPVNYIGAGVPVAAKLQKVIKMNPAKLIKAAEVASDVGKLNKEAQMVEDLLKAQHTVEGRAALRAAPESIQAQVRAKQVAGVPGIETGQISPITEGVGPNARKGPKSSKSSKSSEIPTSEYTPEDWARLDKRKQAEMTKGFPKTQEEALANIPEYVPGESQANIWGGENPMQLGAGKSAGATSGKAAPGAAMPEIAPGNGNAGQVVDATGKGGIGKKILKGTAAVTGAAGLGGLGYALMKSGKEAVANNPTKEPPPPTGPTIAEPTAAPTTPPPEPSQEFPSEQSIYDDLVSQQQATSMKSNAEGVKALSDLNSVPPEVNPEVKASLTQQQADLQKLRDLKQEEPGIIDNLGGILLGASAGGGNAQAANLLSQVRANRLAKFDQSMRQADATFGGQRQVTSDIGTNAARGEVSKQQGIQNQALINSARQNYEKLKQEYLNSNDPMVRRAKVLEMQKLQAQIKYYEANAQAIAAAGGEGGIKGPEMSSAKTREAQAKAATEEALARIMSGIKPKQ